MEWEEIMATLKLKWANASKVENEYEGKIKNCLELLRETMWGDLEG